MSRFTAWFIPLLEGKKKLSGHDSEHPVVIDGGPSSSKSALGAAYIQVCTCMH